MPVEMAVWRLGARGPERVHPTRIETERSLEDAVSADRLLIDDGLMLLGRQVTTAHGKYVDLLAIDEEGTVHVIELKRDRTPREVVAQVLENTHPGAISPPRRAPRRCWGIPLYGEAERHVEASRRAGSARRRGANRAIARHSTSAYGRDRAVGGAGGVGRATGKRERHRRLTSVCWWEIRAGVRISTASLSVAAHPAQPILQPERGEQWETNDGGAWAVCDRRL